MDTVYLCEAQHNCPSSQLGRKKAEIWKFRQSADAEPKPAAPLIEIH